ncbi:hypothetical protein [Roseomonas sp. CAU 1739]|uniref:hypothetical protein n=1 Tax=Roseomonas sp. CAU 1739 TaxID=3140364 RepID=UPI00325A48CE
MTLVFLDSAVSRRRATARKHFAALHNIAPCCLPGVIPDTESPSGRGQGSAPPSRTGPKPPMIELFLLLATLLAMLLRATHRPAPLAERAGAISPHG